MTRLLQLPASAAMRLRYKPSCWLLKISLIKRLRTYRTSMSSVARFDFLILRMSIEVLMLDTIAYALAEFTSLTTSQRHATLYQSHCAPVLSLTAVSPWLVSSTMVTLQQRNLREVCILEWIHCVCASLHHVLEYDIFVQIGGIVFLLWSKILMSEKSKTRSHGNSCAH